MGLETHVQDVASVDLGKRCRPTAINQGGATHVHMAHRSRYDPEMASLTQVFKSGTQGPPASSDGPSALRETVAAHKTTCMDKMCEAAQQTNACESNYTANTRDVVHTIKM